MATEEAKLTAELQPDVIRNIIESDVRLVGNLSKLGPAMAVQLMLD